MRWRAVVDLGSVSTRLLLTNGTDRVRRSVDTFMGGARLSAAGELVPQAISDNALDAIADTLVDYRALADERGAELAAVATSVARSAPNAERLNYLVSSILGVELVVVSGAQEARLGFVGACAGPSLPADEGRPVMTIDVGGGSTEFALGTAAGPERTWSMPMGGSLLAGTYLVSDPPRPDELSAALSVVELHVDDLRRELPEVTQALVGGNVLVLGVGAVEMVAAIEIGLLGVDPLNGEGEGPLQGFELTRDAVEDVFRTIATESRADRAHNPGLPPSRVDDSVGGCGLLVEIMRQLDLDSLVVSQRGLAEGVFALGHDDPLGGKWWRGEG